MTKDKALKLALKFIERVNKDGWILADFEPQMYEVITAIKESLKQSEQDNTYAYASSLAKTIWQKHYIKESPKFALLDTTEGVLTQIDNMTCGLVREKPAQPEQEPVAWWNDTGTHIDLNVSGRGTPLYTTPPQPKEEDNDGRC